MVTGEPMITFMYPRVEYRNVRIDRGRIEAMRQRAQERLESVFAFLDTDGCREQVLLEYFDDNSGLECGRCDLCRSRRNIPSEQALIQSIPEEGIELRSLLASFDVAHENVVKAYLSALEAERQIFFEKGIVKRKDT